MARCCECGADVAPYEVLPGESYCVGCATRIAVAFEHEIMSAVAATDADIALHESEAA